MRGPEAAIPAVVVRDPAQWGTSCITPLKAVPSPHALGADLIPDDLQRNLDYLIARQMPEGTWEPTWSWGEAYPDVWPQAQVEWRGQLTLEALTQLSAFGRIVG